ncbi:MAG: AbrB/MazE/SpoVT family DNA-binding domain-containing protein [Bryobacteraceae bacterium]|nr:AbrB/MazE/SpoVT family DNA-binding domain-containing protein [Bryobacteraceae bacterium]
METTLSPDYRIAIPAEFYEALGLKPGDKLLLTVQGDWGFTVEKPRSRQEALRGLMRYPDDYLAKERAGWR